MASRPVIEFHPAAQCDFDESFDWYAQRSQQAALGFAAEVDDAMQRITAFLEAWNGYFGA